MTCGEYDYNMQNYEQVKTAVTKAEKGENSKTTFYEIKTSGNFIYNHLDFKKKKLYRTTTTAYLDENDGIIFPPRRRICAKGIYRQRRASMLLACSVWNI